jgi:hypothetical protein
MFTIVQQESGLGHRQGFSLPIRVTRRTSHLAEGQEEVKW